MHWPLRALADAPTNPANLADHALMLLLRDLSPLFSAHLVLLVATLTLGPGNFADIRVQGAWFAFLALGWLVTPLWIGNRTPPIRRYLGAVTTSIAIHGVLVALGSVVDFGMQTYLAVFSAGIVIAALWRNHQLRETIAQGPNQQRPSLPWHHLCLGLVLVLFAVCVFRTPRSNDIHQFLLQQQEMLANGSLRVSSIGMSAMEVDQPMPRWKAHYWHLLPCIIARVSGVAVDQILLRYATIPVAFSVLLCLSEVIRSLAGKRVSYPVALIAILGPVLFWYRNFNAFNFSFRITNNLLLDKDFALFFLIPATLWLAHGWIRGRRRYVIPLLGLVPALIRFHPLTSVYLVLLAVPITILATAIGRSQMVRAATWIVATCVLFVSVVALGDAQSNHQQIRQIIELDFHQSLSGRPLHYWVGFYNVIPDTGLPSDTTTWTDNQLQLKGNLIIGCGLLAAMHLCLLILAAFAGSQSRLGKSNRLIFCGLVTTGMLWGLWLISGVFLTRFPHYTAGYERLHWFAFPIALVIVAAALATLIPKRHNRWFGWTTLALIAISSICFRIGVTTPLIHVRGFNSLLDSELAAANARRIDWDQIDANRTLDDLRPGYLQPSDRVLLLDSETTKHYWLIRQGVFWSDPYVEAFAWFHRGDGFLNDRNHFYDLLDRQETRGLKSWIEQKQITLIVDLRDDGDSFIRSVFGRHGIRLEPLKRGVWRIKPPDTESVPANLSG